MADFALKCLFHTFEAGRIPCPDEHDRTLFLNARLCAGLDSLPAHTVFQQHFYPDYRALAGSGLKTVPETSDEAGFDYVLLHLPKQVEEAKGLIADAAVRLGENGVMIAAAANDAGGKRLPGLFGEFSDAYVSESKHKARVVAVKKGDMRNDDVLNAWRADADLRRVPETDFTSCPGLFSWNRVDPGSALLTDYMDQNIKGSVADFGCGYGYLSARMLETCPDVSHLICIDADYRAVRACKQNIGARTKVHFDCLWDDLAAPDNNFTGRFDAVIMNPPFHEGRDTKASLGSAFIETSYNALKENGKLIMVANVHLPYEPVLRSMFGRVEQLASQNGFKILKAEK